MPRDSAGNFSLVAGNPVQSGEVIASTWANTTLDDVAVGLSDSLDRNGRGGMLAPFRFADGTNLLPGAAWVNETSTGFYRFDGGDLRVAVLTQDVMRWQTTGAQVWNETDLQWEDILTGGGGSQVPVNAGTATGQTLRWNTDVVSEEFWENTSVLVVSDDGDVGIGNDSPEVLLRIGDKPISWIPVDSDTLIISSADGIVPNTAIKILSEDGGVGRIDFADSTDSGSGAVYYNHVTDFMRFDTAGAEQVRIDALGNVGIGETNPLQNLVVAAGTVYSALKTTAAVVGNSAVIEWTSAGNYTLQGRDGATFKANWYKAESDPTTGRVNNHIWYTGGSLERMRIDPSGKVNIGSFPNVVAANNFGLMVRKVNGTIAFDPDAAGEYTAIIYANHNASTAHGLLVTNNWLAPASIALNVGVTDTTTGAFTTAFKVDGARDCFIPKIISSTQLGTGADGRIFSVASDERLKDNIVDMPSVLSKVNALRPVNYEWNEDYAGYRDGTMHGLVAQEVSVLFSDVICGHEEELGIDNQQLTGILVKAIQELTARLEALEA